MTTTTHHRPKRYPGVHLSASGHKRWRSARRLAVISQRDVRADRAERRRRALAVVGLFVVGAFAAIAVQVVEILLFLAVIGAVFGLAVWL